MTSHPNIIATDELAVHENGGYVMLALTKDASAIVEQILFGGSAFSKETYGFYTYVNGKEIVVAPGEVRYSTVEYVDYTAGAASPGVYALMSDTYTLSGLTEGSGVLYIEIPTAEAGVALPFGTGYSALDFPDPGDYYAIEFTSRAYLAETFLGPISLKYATSFDPANGFFRKKIADVTVSADGTPSVDQIHMGVIHMPMLTLFKPDFGIARQ